MAAMVMSVDIDRAPEEVFAYVDDLSRHHEWQEDLIGSRVLTEGPTRVGTKVVDSRKLGGSVREVEYEIIERDPPRRSAFRGTSGPIRPVGTVTFEPLDGGSRTRLTMTFDLEGRGIGKAFAPMARKQAAKAIPESHAKLKAILEGRA